MPTQRVLKSVLHGFLGTYTSRYSDYRGYWLFGFLVGDLESLTIDLLDDAHPTSESSEGTAIQLAAERFTDQVHKADLAMSQIREAHLLIDRLSGERRGQVNGHDCIGWIVRFRATATSVTGKEFERVEEAFIARHDANVERRSGRVA